MEVDNEEREEEVVVIGDMNNNKRNPVWTHYVDKDGKRTCFYCGTQFSNNSTTKTLGYHIDKACMKAKENNASSTQPRFCMFGDYM